MNCDDVRNQEITERYLLGRLGDDERELYEQHYFECEGCFEELETYRALQAELKQAVPSSPEDAAPRRARAWAWSGAAAAALAGAALILWLRQPPSSPREAARASGGEIAEPVQPPLPPGSPVPDPGVARPAPDWMTLARVTPPAYTAVVLRGAEGEARRKFAQAMEHYVAGHYAAALSGLEEASELDPAAPEASFFLGICYLLTGKVDPAVQALQRTVALGDTLYLEEAHINLAKAFLRKGDPDRATAELRKAVALEGDHESEARALLERIKSTAPTRE
ncbi:MAG: tetratricopeptide repeat protein [Acidobacteria bacterium]|nr:tetratricopeptide repeat protein [Acidobacteriota bacterium]